MARAPRLLLRRCACLGAVLVVLVTLALEPQPAEAAVTEAWVHRYNNVVNDSNDQAAKVVRDAAGDIIVTGTSGSDILTYNGPANGDDYPSSLALGPNGTVVVTGSSAGRFNSIISYDYATVVYRGTLPPISIELSPGGIRLRFTGTPGHSYNIERAPSVTGPWSIINTQTAPASSLLEYLDATPHRGSGFYRTVQP